MDEEIRSQREAVNLMMTSSQALIVQCTGLTPANSKELSDYKGRKRIKSIKKHGINDFIIARCIMRDNGFIIRSEYSISDIACAIIITPCFSRIARYEYESRK